MNTIVSFEQIFSHQISSRAHLSDPGRPLPDDNVGQQYNVKHRHFPESVNKIAHTKA